MCALVMPMLWQQSWTSGEAACVSIVGASRVAIRNVRFSKSTGFGGPGGISMMDTAVLRLEDSVFENMSSLGTAPAVQARSK